MDDNIKNLDDFTVDTKDEEIIEIFREWLKTSAIYHNEMLKSQKAAYQYYIGNQTDKNDVPVYLSDTVENRIFEGVETLVPIATSGAHQFQVLPGSDMDDSKERAKKLRKVLDRKYETLEIQKKLEDVSRHILIYRFGVLKYKWDFDKDDVDVEAKDPRLILIPKLRTDPHDLPYLIEIQGYSKNEIKKFFPKVEVDDLVKGQSEVDTGETKNNDKDKEYQVFEIWTNDMVAWICSDKVLDKKQNPYYDYQGTEKKVYDNLKKKYKKGTKFYNHLDQPEKPFIFFSTFNISDGPLPSVSLVETVIPIQDSINAQKRSIINNLKQTGNTAVYVDSDALTQEEADNITNEPGLVVRGKGLASEKKIRREPGAQLPNAHFANLQHSESVFDNIMGIHGATRGSAQAKTLGQDIMSRQQDYTRIDMITRVLNRGVARLANGLVQLMKMFYTETHVIKMIGEEEATEFIRLNREDIDNQIEIIVKSGNNLPMDEISLRTEAVQLWQLGAISPQSLFERLKFAQPELEAEKLLLWMQGKLDMETMARIQELTADAQAQAQFGAQPAAPGGGGEAQTPQSAGEGRGSEGILDVLQRAKASLGGQSGLKQPTNAARQGA